MPLAIRKFAHLIFSVYRWVGLNCARMGLDLISLTKENNDDFKNLPPLSQVQRQEPRAGRTRNLRQEPPSLLPPERRAPLDIVGGGGEEVS